MTAIDLLNALTMGDRAMTTLLEDLRSAPMTSPTPRPAKFPPKELEEPLAMVGEAFMTIAMHQMNHRGQLADARRALGRKAIFTPGM